MLANDGEQTLSGTRSVEPEGGVDKCCVRKRCRDNIAAVLHTDEVGNATQCVCYASFLCYHGAFHGGPFPLTKSANGNGNHSKIAWMTLSTNKIHLERNVDDVKPEWLQVIDPSLSFRGIRPKRRVLAVVQAQVGKWWQ